MIRIQSVHFVEDWIDIQEKSFEKYITEPYLVYTRLPDNVEEAGVKTASGGVIPKPHFEKNKNRFHLSVRGAQRIAETTGVVLRAMDNEGDIQDDDLIIIMDADCLPISKDFIPHIRTYLDKTPIVMACEPEHEHQLVRMPHPFFVAFKGKTLHEKDSEGNSLMKCLSTRVEISGNWWGLLMNWHDEKGVTTIERTNIVNLHPLYYGIYDDVLYHHWAGSRKMITRPDRRRVAKTGEDLELIAQENFEQSKGVMLQLTNQSDTFMNYLMGNYDGELQ